MLNEELEKKVDFLVNHIPDLIKKFNIWGYRKDADFYFYKLLMSERKHNPIENLLNTEKFESFIGLIYITLISWNMNQRRAIIRPFNEFSSNIQSIKEHIIDLSEFQLAGLSSAHDLKFILDKLKQIYKKLDLMVSTAKLVSNAKTLHFLLPDLIMPMDRENTLKYFYNNKNESINKFLLIFKCSYEIVNRIELNKYLDHEWNQTILKIIDNAIIYYIRKKFYKKKLLSKYWKFIKTKGIPEKLMKHFINKVIEEDQKYFHH